jgi:Geobacter CxxxxCH...CXXCH motif (GSu_C4xC__C2xCH)
MRQWISGTFLLVSLAVFAVACSDLADPVEVTTHPAGWADPLSSRFHGTFTLETPGKTDTCATCHGDDFSGSIAGVSCESSGCHSVFPHPAEFADTLGLNLHTVTLAEDVGWDLTVCQTCHGSDYAGNGFEEKNCLTCHTEEDGPEACTTCHGDGESIAPPEDLSGNTSTSAPGVGAHQTHMGMSHLTDILNPECSHCHNKPERYSSAGHTDGGPPSADIVFSSFATSDGQLSTSYDPATNTCSNVYCHGNFEFKKEDSSAPSIYTAPQIEGNRLVMTWTDVGTDQAACGTCHDLPPKGHLVVTTCNGCHPRVVNANFEIIGPDLHINGLIELF